MQDTLQQRITDKQPLTEYEQADLLELLGKGCRDKRKRQLARELSYVPDIDSYGIYSRVFVNDDGRGASYCAGQDYTAELSLVRKLLTEG